MTTKKFSNALGNIGENYVDEAVTYTAKKKSNAWLKWSTLAACFLFVITLMVPFIYLGQDKLPTEYMQIIEYNNSYYEVCDDKSVLKKFGIEKSITEDSAGEIITYLAKKHPGGKSQYVATEEKTNIILFSYAKTPCEAIYVICDNGKYDAVLFCNFVVLDTDAVSLDKLYSLYGIEEGADISSISVVDNRTGKKVPGVTLTDSKIIRDFYASSLNLVDYNFSDYHEINYGHIKTEEELVEAYDKTYDSKITIRIETDDGLRFYLEYDADGGWIYSSGSMRHYKATTEISEWFKNHLK